MRDGGEGETTPQKNDKLRPRYTILGGWAERTDGSAVEREAQALVHSLDCVAECLALYAPLRHGEIATVYAAEYAIMKVHFAFSKPVEKKGQLPGAPSWRAIERGSEAGAAKRRAREASEGVSNKLPADVVVEQNAVCWRKGGEWARIDVPGGQVEEGPPLLR